MNTTLKATLNGVKVTPPIQVTLKGIFTSIQTLSSVNCERYLAIGMSIDDMETIRSIEQWTKERVVEERDEIFLRYSRLKLSPEDVAEKFCPFNAQINLFQGRPDKDRPILIANSTPTHSLKDMSETLNGLIENDTRVSINLECSRIWLRKTGSWGLGWSLTSSTCEETSHNHEAAED